MPENNEKKTPEERQRLSEIRAAAKQEFPPAVPSHLSPVTTGIPAQLRQAREEKGLTWYAVAKLANIPNPVTIRDIECGRDAKLSNIEAVALALGLRLELVDA
ncbi:helix-turn-helix domain-containing protein [Anatilimnocola sp. NA78]|uniref:helix-turn-helix domain-containing protein n=1 Tax=Anatilimnocola sp. NA78 TaxID=3415683 RepID=UPI003CE45798